MPQIRPITDLRNTNEISELCHAKNEPIFITKNGMGDLVVMSMETYDSMIENAEIDAAITRAMKDRADGKNGRNAEEVFAELRRKYLE